MRSPVPEIARCEAQSLAVRCIKRLPFGRAGALRWWNRFSRLLGRRQTRTYFGSLMYSTPQDSIQATILHFGTWEPNISRLLGQIVEPGDTTIDLGANVGYYSLLLSRLVGDEGKVIAVEALPELAAQIERHARMNGARNIDVINAAVSDEAGEVNIYRAPETNIGMSTTRAERGYPCAGTVPSITLVDLLADPKRVSLIKCDIEGAEVPVLRQLLANLDRFSDRLSVAVEASTTDNYDWPTLFVQFLEAGFKAYEIPNRLVTLWDELLRGEALKPIRPIFTLPAGEPDILFTRKPLSPDHY